MTATKIDLFKQHKQDYTAPRQPVLVDLKPVTYLAVSGSGDPQGEDFQDGVAALYAVAYTIKMTRKKHGGTDYVICKLEARWWTGEGDAFLPECPRDQWRWQLLIRTPEFVAGEELERAHRVLLDKGKTARVKQVSLIELSEGLCVQMLHLGPYSEEGTTIMKMMAFARGENYGFHGKHHEIYLSDPRRVEAEKLKTILRHPVTPRTGND